MATYNRHTYLATLGNYPVKAAGAPVVLSGKSKNTYSVLTGEIVVWNQRTNTTLSVADIATAPHVSIGVGIGREGTLADDIIHIAGEDFDLCKANIHATVSRPSCPVPQVVDVFFDCTKCDEVYTIAFHLDDSRIRSQFNYNDKAEYVFTVPAQCHGCDDCSPEHNCEELACAFVDLINGNVQKDPNNITYFRKADMSKQYQPFTATRIFNQEDSRKVFCLAAADTECETCVNLPALDGILIGETEYPFTYTVSPSDDTVTLPAQLERVVEEINRVFEENEIGGSAVLTAGTRKCCPYNITINSCEAVIELITGETTVEPCETSNPFTAQTIAPLCVGCDAEPTEINLTCGFSIIVDPLDLPCDCKYPPNQVTPNYYGRTIEPQFAGEGWKANNFYWTESQAQVLPQGHGFFWQDKAHYGNHNGGTGRNWRYTNRRVGRIGLPDAGSRASNAANLIRCNETYCVYNILSGNKETTRFNNQVIHKNTALTYMLIPEGDTATKDSFEPYLVALQERGICAPGDVECTVDEG